MPLRTPGRDEDALPLNGFAPAKQGWVDFVARLGQVGGSYRVSGPFPGYRNPSPAGSSIRAYMRDRHQGQHSATPAAESCLCNSSCPGHCSSPYAPSHGSSLRATRVSWRLRWHPSTESFRVNWQYFTRKSSRIGSYRQPAYSAGKNNVPTMQSCRLPIGKGRARSSEVYGGYRRTCVSKYKQPSNTYIVHVGVWTRRPRQSTCAVGPRWG